MKKLFGTDGIRGHAGEFPLDEKTIRSIGASLSAQFANKLGRDPRFVCGRDTRESGAAIESAIRSGTALGDGTCESAGVITTPGVAFLTATHGFDAGIVISASHNPYQDNGLKIFLPSGKKVDDAIETHIEEDIFSGKYDGETYPEIENTSVVTSFTADYIAHLLSEVEGTRFDGIKVVLDCANGAASEIAPAVFESLGADVISINRTPDGRNINKDCGSLHLEDLQAKVVGAGASIGVAFDGDADRSLFVDEHGRIVDGDATLWIMANYLKSHEMLTNSKVVATVMSNIGLEIAFRSIGVELLRASVGDKYVLSELLDTDSEVGGEQSGHIIFPRRSLVGDGIRTALLLLRAMVEKRETLSGLTSGFTQYPQILVNVKVKEKIPFESVPEIAAAAAEIESELHGEGRLLLRYSGTENLARVMIEGRDQAEVEEKAGRLADVIRNSLA
ncbi:MAG: phosphoglucosamine mutase [Pyrinomonadaceae bacterium]|nr:phosphoglucosamine mutase [Pyrinomonadaceae bacterium]MBP6212748.1 phosphoglucosamine mutase [Pyrinomonadaceae bacterium]